MTAHYMIVHIDIRTIAQLVIIPSVEMFSYIKFKLALLDEWERDENGECDTDYVICLTYSPNYLYL